MGKEQATIIEVIFALIVGLMIVLSVPELKNFFTNILGQVLAVILLAIFVGIVIFVVWLLIDKQQHGGSFI